MKLTERTLTGRCWIFVRYVKVYKVRSGPVFETVRRVITIPDCWRKWELLS